MKKIKLLNWILVLFVAFQFSSCNDEPLEGEFPTDGDNPAVGVGAFIATVDGVGFTANTASGNLTSDNLLTVTGTITETGEKIVLTVEDAGLGVFSIVAGLGSQNGGIYYDGDTSSLPYISAGLLGATGQLEITELNTETLKVSGTFSFTGYRFALDADGNPILDADGNPTMEMVTLTAGAFNQIGFTTVDEGGGGTPIENEFFAKVDGVDFTALAVTTTQTEIAGISMIKIVAVNQNEEIIRIDIPEDLGIGTFAMEEISDGTKLIALYNPHTGGENLTSNPGTITITKFNTFTGIIEATFAFTASDPLGIDPAVHEITEGSFEVDYIVTPGETITSFTAEIDGEFFSADSILVEESVFEGTSRFSIIALNTDTNQKMGLFFPTDIEIGTYEMSTNLITGEEKFGQYTPDFGNSITFISNPGTITIIDYDPESRIIEGTFTFTAVDILNQDPTVHEVMTGEFTLEY